MIWTKVNPPCHLRQLDPDFYALLSELQKFIPLELTITSAYRTYDYELSKGRKGTSSHCKGLAVDISCCNSSLRAALVSKAFALGIDRIGIYPTFIHLDVDKSKVHPCIWLK